MSDGLPATSDLIRQIIDRLQVIRGIRAVVLGGSRARGTHTPTSDIDLGICYDQGQPLDIEALGQLAREIDDEHRADLVTSIGGWGPWINGGGWLTCQTIPVDFLYRDLDQVKTVIDQCQAGEFSHVYQPGHPHGFPSYIYMGEIALCKPLWDSDGIITTLKKATQPYPPSLQKAITRRFFWEADFSLRVAHKGASRADVSYVAGCCFRCVTCLMQTLFALNETYWMNEKGAVALAAALPHHPANLVERINEAFGRLQPDSPALDQAIDLLSLLVQDSNQLLQSQNLN